MPLLSTIASVLNSALRAMERLDMIFWSRLGSMIVTLTLGLWLLAVHGLAGAVTGRLVAYLTSAIAVVWFYRAVKK